MNLRADQKQLNEKVIDTYLRALGLSLNDSAVKKAERLQAFLDQYTWGEQKTACDPGCGGHSDSRFMCCPFCGDDGGVAGSKEDERVAIDDMVKRSQKKVDKSQTRKAEALVAPVLTEQEDEGEDLDLPADLSIEALHEKLKQAGMSIPTKPTEQDLNEAVAAIETHHMRSVVSGYDLGAWLLKVRALKLWMLRTKNGAAAYSSWTQFVQRETPISVRYANKMMAVAFVYSRTDVESVGFKRLSILLSIQDPEKRAALVEAAKKGELTAAEARQAVVEASGGEAPPPRQTPLPGQTGFRGKANTGSKAGKKEPEQVEEKKTPEATPQIITATIAVGRHTVKLWKTGPGSTPKPAKTLGDSPHGELTLANGVVLRFSLAKNKKSGQLELVMQGVRPDTEA